MQIEEVKLFEGLKVILRGLQLPSADSTKRLELIHVRYYRKDGAATER